MDNLVMVWDASFSAVNMPYTVALLIMFIYWIAVILGGMDLDTFDWDMDHDFDLNHDIDHDFDHDFDADAHADLSGLGAASMAFLRFFHIGEVPLMIVLSFIALGSWMASLIINYTLGNTSVIFALILIVPILAVGLFLSKIITLPLRKFFRSLKSGTSAHVDLIGKTCTVTTSEVTVHFGQAEIHTDGSPISIAVRTVEGETLTRNDEAVIVEWNKEKNTYQVHKYS